MRKLFLCLIIALVASGIACAQNIIDPELQSVLDQKSNEKISINIIFKSQLDRADLRERSNQYVDKETKRQAVIKELKNFSEETQQGVLSVIKSAESKNEVSDVVCHWLSNSITCTTTRDVIEKLAKRDDILLIGHNCDRNALMNETVSAAEEG